MKLTLNCVTIAASLLGLGQVAAQATRQIAIVGSSSVWHA